MDGNFCCENHDSWFLALQKHSSSQNERNGNQSMFRTDVSSSQYMPKKPALALLISPAQDLKHRPVWGSEVIPPRLARTLNGTNEFDACCFHGRACCVDIIYPEGDHRTGGEKRVKWLLGAIEFQLRPIGQVEPRNLRLVSNGLHAHHMTKELDHLFKLSGSQSQPSESFDLHNLFPHVLPVLLPASTASHPSQTMSEYIPYHHDAADDALSE